MKAAAQHTPGPWQIEGYGFITSAKDGAHVCTVNEGDTQRGYADAKLIAAAPELLALVKEALGEGEIDLRDWNPRARAALRKATEGAP